MRAQKGTHIHDKAPARCAESFPVDLFAWGWR